MSYCSTHLNITTSDNWIAVPKINGEYEPYFLWLDEHNIDYKIRYLLQSVIFIFDKEEDYVLFGLRWA